MYIKQSCPLLGSNHFDQSLIFYRKFFLNSQIVLREDKHDFRGEEHSMLWVICQDKPLFVIANFTANHQPAEVANGSMIYLAVHSASEVELWYQKAIDSGATDEGKPGIRYKEYAAYFRDLDGHKFCIRTDFVD